jgi:hypothetical protein
VAFEPDPAFVAVGANDAFRRSFTARAVKAELAEVLRALRDSGALVVTFGCFEMGRTSFLPPERRAGLSERLYEFGGLTEDLSRRYGGVHVDFLAILLSPTS